MMYFRYFTILLSVVLFLSCSDDHNNDSPTQLFEMISDKANITFENRLSVNDSMNYFSYGYFYMGGGVATGDVNNDGLDDIYFTGNMVPNRLYLNEGNMKFRDVTSKARVGGKSQWMTGCTMIDVNTDGLLDLYVSVSGKWKSRKNLCYINQGIDDDGVPIFKEEAEARGLADNGYSIQSTFFDYDNDGDLDAFIANYPPTPFSSLSGDFKKYIDHVEWSQSDHLLENDGNGFFRDVTAQTGLLNFGLTVGIIAADFTNDGLTDIYLSNDFFSPDRFYINNGDGTFSDHLKEMVQHTSLYGMGIDAADINEDGLLDFAQLDMTPKDNFRSKANMNSMDIQGFRNSIDAGLHYQYMYNVLQVSQGVSQKGLPFYSDQAKINDLHKTDWSWACLFADFDNDGEEDLFVSNGTRRDINNRDYFAWLERPDVNLKIKYKEIDAIDLSLKMPYKKIDNFIFKREGNRFNQVNDEWGLSFKGFSNGAAYSDLDNDGDLDLVINNIDSVAALFQNHSNDVLFDRAYLKVKLQGPSQNPFGIGTKLYLQTSSSEQYKEQIVVRGYQSSVSPVLHFGLGGEKIIQLRIVWPDGKAQTVKPLENTTILVDYKDSKPIKKNTLSDHHLFVDQKKLSYHKENEYDDYAREILLPHKMSRFGPALAIADVNGDGLEDFYLGGAFGAAGSMHFQQLNGHFTEEIVKSPNEVNFEDIDAVFADFDQDHDYDLYVVSGGNEYEDGHANYKDRIYLNEKGTFIFQQNVLPDISISGSTVKPYDFDLDGDLDLFVGGRQVPGKYPSPVSSQLLINKLEEGNLSFVDATEELAPELHQIGMVTDAEWDDIDADGDNDLIVVGEWMAITILLNEKGKLAKKITIDNSLGWWFSIEKADFDRDGDHDFVVGNLGENYKYKASTEKTFDVYSYDYDQNGKLDIVLSYYQDDMQFPVRGKECSTQQIPDLGVKFVKYNDFASSTLNEIYSKKLLDQSLHYQAETFASYYMENTGNGAFNLKKLPFEVQMSSIKDFLIDDFDKDGSLDIVLGGNLFVSEVETPRNDACYGWFLKGDSKGNFEYVPNLTSGLHVPFDIRKIGLLKSSKPTSPIILFANNNGPVISYQLDPKF